MAKTRVVLALVGALTLVGGGMCAYAVNVPGYNAIGWGVIGLVLLAIALLTLIIMGLVGLVRGFS